MTIQEQINKDDYFSNRGRNIKRKRMIFLGFSQYHIDVPNLLSYHLDEVKLRFIEIKMPEFKRYIDSVLPYVKYIFLEKSEDLIFDIIDRFTRLLDDRQYIFLKMDGQSLQRFL